MKQLLILIALMITVVFQANAQTTYSSLELDGSGNPTGNAIDITITVAPDNSVTYTRTVRTATTGDEYSFYNLTGETIIQVGDEGVLSFPTEDPYFIPFDGSTGIRVSSDDVTFKCTCGWLSTQTEGCTMYSGAQILCHNNKNDNDCPGICVLRCLKGNPGTTEFTSAGIFINATSLTQN